MGWFTKKTPEPVSLPITETLRDAARYLGMRQGRGELPFGEGLLFQAQIIRELANRIKELERKDVQPR
jgi:hypothetical protein